MGDNNKTVRTRARSASDMQATEEKLDLILSKITRMEWNSASLKSDINSIKEDNKKFTAEINKTLDFYSEKLVEIERNVGHTEGKVKIQSENIDLLISDSISLRRELNCLEIQGIPENKTENVTDLVIAVADVLGFKMVPSMIEAAHRLAAIPGRFHRLAMKKRGFSASNLGFSSDLSVYVILAMTRETSILWADTRKLKEELSFKFVWITVAGKIFLRKSDGDRPEVIEEHLDLERLRRESRTGPGMEGRSEAEA
ncbi:hypothetical protein J6590_020021 [Homalodisca vitripennis]|nr:hypothetical protein J6590_020021 [Homalodisca vitripennis]